MRTTLTLDDDVAAALARRQRETKLRQEVNDVLRAGLAASEPAGSEGDDYELPVFDPGNALITIRSRGRAADAGPDRCARDPLATR